MTRVLTAREYQKATAWKQAAVIEGMNGAREVYRKRRELRAAEVAALNSEFELAHARMLLAEEKRRVIEPFLPTEAEGVRRWALHHYNEPEGVGEQRMQDLVTEAFA